MTRAIDDAILMNNAEIIQLLVVSAQSSPANRLLSDLRRDGGAQLTAVSGLAELRKALEEAAGDAVVCFEGEGAPAPEQVLAALQEAGQPLPCIVSLAEDSAADAAALLRQGAADVVGAAEREKLAFSVRREVGAMAQRRRARLLEVSLRELEKRHRTLLDSTGEALAYVHEGVHLYCNPGYAEFFGYADTEAVRRTPLLDLVAGDEDRAGLRKLLATPLEGERRVTLEGRRQNGATVAMELCFMPVEYDGEPCLQLAVKHAPGNSEYSREVAEIETRDLLTRLHNRAHFMRKLEQAIAAALRQGRNGALLLVNLNEFLDIESAVGRTGANQILADISRFLQESANRPFSAARLSAHEFGLLLYESNAEEALKLADYIRGKINNRLSSAALPSLELSCSVGIALVNAHALDADTLVAGARANLGAGPDAGGSYAFRVGDSLAPGMNGLLGYLDEALAQERFKLLFQPVVPLKGGDFQAYDVLARMLDKDDNEIPPAVFIPLVRLSGLGEAFDRAVVTRALRMLEKTAGESSLVIKLTQASLMSRTFLPWLSEVLSERRSPSHRLAFQISEVELHREPAQVSAFCRGLEELNLKRVVTHFGCALDPFRLLPDIRPAYVILDESLLRDIVYSEQQKRNVQTLVDDLHRQGYLAGAPRVEDMDLLPMLWDIGVDVVQGYCLQGPSQEMNYEFTQEQEITLGAVPGQ